MNFKNVWWIFETSILNCSLSWEKGDINKHARKQVSKLERDLRKRLINCACWEIFYDFLSSAFFLNWTFFKLFFCCWDFKILLLNPQGFTFIINLRCNNKQCNYNSMTVVNRSNLTPPPPPKKKKKKKIRDGHQRGKQIGSTSGPTFCQVWSGSGSILFAKVISRRHCWGKSILGSPKLNPLLLKEQGSSDLTPEEKPYL